MHGPDGVDYKNEIVYIEIVRPERLVYNHLPGPQFETTVTFAAQGKQTKLTMRLLFNSVEERDRTVKTFHAIEGGNQTLDRLEERLRKIIAGECAEKSAGREMVLTRLIGAPRDAVFAAWTDPELLKNWWGPKGFTNPVCEVDARPGGAIRVHMRAPDGRTYPMTGIFREIIPPERLVFRSAALDEKGNPIFEVLNTVTFEERNGKTQLTVHAFVAIETADAAKFLAGMEQGWSQTLDRLAEAVQA